MNEPFEPQLVEIINPPPNSLQSCGACLSQAGMGCGIGLALLFVVGITLGLLHPLLVR